MITLIILLSLVLFGVIAVQVGRLTEITASLRNEDDVETDRNKLHGILGMLFLVGFMVFCFATAYYYKNDMYSFGGNMPASEHGVVLDNLFYVTLVPTGLVFVLCHIALFWFAYKYKGEKGRKVLYIPHDNRLEIIWMAVPAVVMTVLVVFGLKAWNDTMADVPEGAKPGKDYIEVEATGMQFAWTLRHPGKDNLLGEKYFSASSRLRFPSSSRNGSEPRTLRIASASCSTFFSSTTICSRNSGIPTCRVEITGLPHAIASIITLGKPSPTPTSSK